MTRVASMNGKDQCGEPHRSLEGPGYLGMWLIKSANMWGRMDGGLGGVPW